MRGKQRSCRYADVRTSSEKAGNWEKLFCFQRIQRTSFLALAFTQRRFSAAREGGREPFHSLLLYSPIRACSLSLPLSLPPLSLSHSLSHTHSLSLSLSPPLSLTHMSSSSRERSISFQGGTLAAAALSPSSSSMALLRVFAPVFSLLSVRFPPPLSFHFPLPSKNHSPQRTHAHSQSVFLFPLVRLAARWQKMTACGLRRRHIIFRCFCF